MENKNTKLNEIPKKHFESPKAEIIVFSTEDVITTSGYPGFDGEEHVFGIGDH